MTKIGEIFKIFRTGKNITLKEASQNIVSYPFLSKFERGLTDISFTHLLELLDRINVQLSEFEFLYSKYNADNNDLLPSFQSAYQSGDVVMLKHHLQTWQHKQGKFAELQVIQLKMMLSTLNIDSITKSDILILEADFKTIHSWTFFELYLFGHAMPFLEEKFMFHLFQELHQKGILYDNFRYDSFSMLFYIYNNIILFMLDHNHLDTADLLIQKLTYYFNQQEKDYYHRARIFNLQGLALYLQNKKELGLRLIRKANLISYLSEHDLKFINNEKRYLSKYLTNADLQMVFDFSEII
ncbi:helix-turn-helix domain-containing protein [Leuconostoc gelidum subsp. gasicomitatum]|uniref:helix-turn-helix domain-containing protein n=1 Tax=Leuconostoc gasicomitatum TaxID=115778 RepID=UPI000744996B|nr:Rgg/GadR/MutR family transcriptional regulator [Leuconostoc gasicomitatum]MBZ5953209.1 helix-turn-helix domain-containing protein [Leuconostoc gasicomitatum]MBZ5988533.1 helix-turn-helix domain-containing protein [Leuconostoc gasicomitatum]MBZ5990798.1 helix-turn-helix domain-containing protein [Leuconostoc gasicomitatum]CUR62715.1 Transcriptional activator,MutR family [Leuconostoc gasicomitatum KG16-1]